MIQREIYSCQTHVNTDIDAYSELDALVELPEGTAMLAYQDDGILWGEIINKQLVTGNSVDSKYIAAPDMKLLQEARFFWERGELHIWRDSENILQACRIDDDVDAPGEFIAYYDEAQMLWGDTVEPVAGGWTRMSDGAQGLIHTVPLNVTQKQVQPNPKEQKFVRPLRLTVRNYLKQDETTGALYVALSRLVKLEAN